MEKLFFNKELISGLNKWSDSFGRGREARFFQKTCSDFFYANICWTKKNCLPRFLATIANLPNNAWVQNNLDFFGTIANLATTQDTTITMTMTYFHDLAFRFQETSWLVTTCPGTP